MHTSEQTETILATMPQFYVVTDADQFPVAFFMDAINDDIPDDAVVISQAQWQELVDNQGCRKFDGNDIVIFEPPGPSLESQWAIIRAKRARLLAGCDWTMLPDSPLNEVKRGEWLAYRRALRDMPDTAKDPGKTVWPTQPE